MRRFVRSCQLDGLVIFADDSATFRNDFFDEVQKVEWVGAASVGILVQHGFTEAFTGAGLNWEPPENEVSEGQGGKKKQRMGVQGPVCDSNGTLTGWHTMPHSPAQVAAGVREVVGGAPQPVEEARNERRALVWMGFVINSKLVWDWGRGKEEAEADSLHRRNGSGGALGTDPRPEWVKDWEPWSEGQEKSGSAKGGAEVEMGDLLGRLVLNESFIQPLGDCGGEELGWWLRVEARADSKFYAGYEP